MIWISSVSASFALFLFAVAALPAKNIIVMHINKAAMTDRIIHTARLFFVLVSEDGGFSSDS